jgi:hypothetical protein
MKSDRLKLETAQAVTSCLRTAAGEVEHTIDLLESHVSSEDLVAYKRMVGKVIVAIYSGLADPVLEGFPEYQKDFYRENEAN